MRIVLLFGILLVVGIVRAQQKEEIRWLDLAEAEKQYQETQKPYLFDFYTDWCGWCKHMDKTTYSDPGVITFINRYFYPVRINAESADTIVFRNKLYAPVRQENKFISSLALEMLEGRLSYPSTVFLYEPGKINLVVPGYLGITRMQGFLVFFIENAWKSTDVNEFLADFETVFGENTPQRAPQADYWISFRELEEMQLKKRRKILLFLEASWNNSSKMMERVVLPDSLFAAEAREHFYCLRLDVQSQDTLVFMNHKFWNAGEQNHKLPQLAIALSDKVLKVPGIYLFDEEGRLMENLFYYLGRKRGSMILDYVGNDNFNSMTWEDYVRMREKETL